MEMINFKKKKMKTITNEEQQSYQNAKICYVCKGKFEDRHAKDKTYGKVRNHCHHVGEDGGVAYCICNLKYSLPKEIHVVFKMDLTTIIILS